MNRKKLLSVLPENDVDAILNSMRNYARFEKIKIDILDVEKGALIVRVEQVAKVDDKVFNSKELTSKAKEVFSNVDIIAHYRTLLFKGKGIEAVSPSWVKNQLKKYDLYQKDLVNDMKIDRHVISRLLSGKYEFTKWHKAAFFFYFRDKI